MIITTGFLWLKYVSIGQLCFTAEDGKILMFQSTQSNSIKTLNQAPVQNGQPLMTPGSDQSQTQRHSERNSGRYP